MILYYKEEILYIIILVIVLALIVLGIRWLTKNKETVSFFTTGIDSGFSLSEILSLWKLARLCELEEPTALYLSVPALSRSISKLISTSRANGTEYTKKTQKFLTKLYAYRTKVELDPLAKKGLKSSKFLDEGQKLRIVLKGVGVFVSRIEMNGRELIIHVPSKDGIITMYGNEWVGKRISVYLWRKDDACYAFDSAVIGSGQYGSTPVLYITHSSDLTRVQKRKSVRTKCSIGARLYISGRNSTFDTNVEDMAGGYRCMLEDISADGALIRIGGKGSNGISIKLQFPIGDNYIVMAGIVRAVEYNKELNQSRIHFECIKIDPEMKNVVLSFVYDVMPQDEKDVFEALKGTEEDENEETGAPRENSDTNENEATEQNTEETEPEVILAQQAEKNATNSKDDLGLESFDEFDFPKEE